MKLKYAIDKDGRRIFPPHDDRCEYVQDGARHLEGAKLVTPMGWMCVQGCQNAASRYRRGERER